MDHEDLESPTLTETAAKGETPPEEQPSPSRSSTSTPGAVAALKSMWFRRTKNWPKQQSFDKSRTKPSLGNEKGSERALPRLRSSIQLVMQEIQQVSRGISSAKPWHLQLPGASGTALPMGGREEASTSCARFPSSWVIGFTWGSWDQGTVYWKLQAGRDPGGVSLRRPKKSAEGNVMWPACQSLLP